MFKLPLSASLHATNAPVALLARSAILPWLRGSSLGRWPSHSTHPIAQHRSTPSAKQVEVASNPPVQDSKEDSELPVVRQRSLDWLHLPYHSRSSPTWYLAQGSQRSRCYRRSSHRRLHHTTNRCRWLHRVISSGSGFISIGSKIAVQIIDFAVRTSARHIQTIQDIVVRTANDHIAPLISRFLSSPAFPSRISSPAPPEI